MEKKLLEENQALFAYVGMYAALYQDLVLTVTLT